jgi:creatinine amidohydrolase/Fe(II)-dependent formamide hydrolase-like protein
MLNSLTMNTGMDLVDQLVKKNTILEERVTVLTKDAEVCEAKSSSASNGASTAQKAVEALAKRVAALASKK